MIPTNVIVGVLAAGCAALAGCASVRPGPKLPNTVFDCASLSQREPVKYPRDALQRKVSGWVVLAYEVSGSRASNIRTVDAEPAGVFVDSATEALQKSIFPTALRRVDCSTIYLFEAR
jgi:hypothetical protein